MTTLEQLAQAADDLGWLSNEVAALRDPKMRRLGSDACRVLHGALMDLEQWLMCQRTAKMDRKLVLVPTPRRPNSVVQLARLAPAGRADFPGQG